MYELGLTSQLIRKVVILRPLILFYFFISISNGSYDKNCRQGASDYWLTCTEIFNIISKTRYNFVSFCFPLHEVGYCDWSIMEIVSCRRLWKWYSKFLMTICHNYHLWKMNDIKRLYISPPNLILLNKNHVHFILYSINNNMYSDNIFIHLLLTEIFILIMLLHSINTIALFFFSPIILEHCRIPKNN